MDKNKTQKRRGFTLVELLVVLLILGVLVGLAVPRYMEAQKMARARTFAANVREIVSTLEVYRMDQFTATAAYYPTDLSALKSYFTQPPINPYTGQSMLSDNPEESGLRYENHDNDYTLKVTQADVDNVDNNDTTTTLCTAIPTMLPTMACESSTPHNEEFACETSAEDFGDLLNGFTYESRIDGFTPCITSVTATTVASEDGQQSIQITVPNIKMPNEIVDANYKFVIIAPNNYDANEIINFIEGTFGYDNVTTLYQDQNLDAFFSIESVLSPFDDWSLERVVQGLIFVVLDDDNTLLAVFDDAFMLQDHDNLDRLLAIATLGKGYSGVYSPLLIYGHNINPEAFTLLTDHQKRQIRDALLPVYPGIKTNVD